MTATAEPAARTNREGHPCPPWCTDHHPDAVIHRTGTTEITFNRPRQYAYCDVAGLEFAGEGRTEVRVGARHHNIKTSTVIGGSQYLPPDDARKLADLLEVLALASPAQHRQLAAAIRQAAAVISEASGA